MSDVKKKLFIPRKIDERLVDWNNMQPIIDGVQINQYDIKTGNPTGRWGEGDIDGGDTINLFATYWDVFSDDASWDGVNGEYPIKDDVFNYIVKKIQESFADDLSGYGPLDLMHFDLTLPLYSQKVKDEFEFLYNENPPLKESEQPKKKLFIPRKLSGDDSRYAKWNKEQPIVDGIQINQYDINGKPIGYWEHYNSDGKYTNKGEYVNGLRNGIWKSISDDGILIHNGLYRYGERVKFLPLDESKKLFIPRKLSGEDSRYAKWNKEQPIVDGERINQYNVETGLRYGLWETYHTNGKLDSKIGYKNGSYEGIYQTFHINGKIQYDGQTKNGEFDGLWKQYYITGQLKNIGEYNDGKSTGIWKWYYPFNDQLEHIWYYIDGRPDGLAIDFYMNGNIGKKHIYDMGKRIAFIFYNMYGVHDNSMNWKDEYDNMVINEQIGNKDDILKSWGDYYGSDDTANWELESYESEVEDLIENGGNVYRVLFVDNLSEVNLKDMGEHWTTSCDNVIDVAEINQQYYGKNKQKVIVIEAYVEPNSVTIEDVDVKGNPHEKEVNIINGRDIKIKQVFEYVGRKFIPIDMNIKEQMGSKENILKSFEPQKGLNHKVWDDEDKLKKKIKDTLVAIGQEFHKSLDVEAPIEDIIFTGSLANYNWSQYSDVDLHVLIDFNKFDDKELIKKYFDAKKAIWNDNHDIKIKGYDVELYAQDIDEPHESTGIYSVMKDEWIKKPRAQDVNIDKEIIKKKVRQFEVQYNRIVRLYNSGKFGETKKSLDKIKDKIKKYRKAGLDKSGEMSTENLVFKTMRRSGLIKKIFDLSIKTTDKEFTIETLDESKKLFIPRKLSPDDSRYTELNNKQPIKDGIRINQYNYNGNKEGYWEEYHDNGKLYSKGYYVNNKKDGIWEEYHDNGKLYSKGSYKNGEKEGYWEQYYYHYNGKLSSKSMYKNGKEDGIWEWYGDNGKLYNKRLYKNGIIIKELPLTESKKLFIPRKLSPDDNRYTDWNKEQPIVDGERINQYNVDTGKKEGLWVRYYDNDQLESKGKYKNGLRDGVWEYYYWNGTLERELYNNGEIVKNPQLIYNINEGKLSDNIDDILKNFKKNIGLDIGFLMSFGAGINGLIRNVTSLIKQSSLQPLTSFELINLAIAMIVVYLRKNKSFKDFKNEMLSIVAFTSLMPGYNDMVNSLLGNVDFMEAFMTIIKSVGVYSMLNHFKGK